MIEKTNAVLSINCTQRYIADNSSSSSSFDLFEYMIYVIHVLKYASSIATTLLVWLRWTSMTAALGATSLYAYTAAVVAWMYYITITQPLRVFYFEGPVWGNIAPEQVCFTLTGVASDWWNKTDDRINECHRLLNTKFHSFEMTIICVLYFASLGFAVIYFICRCCFLRPIVNEMRRMTSYVKSPSKTC